MTKWIHNKQTDARTYQGREIDPLSYFQIPLGVEGEYAQDNSVINDIALDLIAISSDGETDIIGSSLQIDYLKGFLQKVEVTSQPLPFSSKIVNGKTISIRSMGQSFAVAVGANTLNYTIPFAACKITGLEILGGELGDSADFKVAHPQAGVVGQFAFGNYIAKDFYSRVSSYESDLVAGLIVRIVYNSMSAKTVYVNYLLHEVI